MALVVLVQLLHEELVAFEAAVLVFRVLPVRLQLHDLIRLLFLQTVRRLALPLQDFVLKFPFKFVYVVFIKRILNLPIRDPQRLPPLVKILHPNLPFQLRLRLQPVLDLDAAHVRPVILKDHLFALAEVELDLAALFF